MQNGYRLSLLEDVCDRVAKSAGHHGSNLLQVVTDRDCL